MFVVGLVNDRVYQYSLSTGFDIGSVSYVKNFSIASQESAGQGIAFNTDGTKMFILGSSGDDVNEYNLSGAYDVATASFSKVSSSLSSQETSCSDIFFNADGTKMYIIGYTSDSVHEYNLSTGFDVSTISYTGKSLSVAAKENTPLGLTFNTDGTKLFIIGVGSNKIHEYAIASPAAPSGYHAVHTTNSTDSTYWTDINSMTADEDAGNGSVHYCVSTDDRAIWKIAHNTNGIRSIVRNNSGTWQYNSNSTYGSTTWANGATNTELATLQESMGTSVNRMNKTQLEAVADANHFPLANDLDLAIIFNLSSGTGIPSSDGVSINYDANVLNKGAILGTDYDFDAPAQNKVRITSLASNNLKVRVV
jgi:hypothetical protein